MLDLALFQVWRISSWLALAIAAVVLVFLLHRERHKFVFKFLLGGLFSVVLNQSLKYMFNVPRAIGFGPAFPSFHAQMIFFFAVLASLEDRRLAWLLVPVAFLIGASRMALGFHSFFEVLVGAILGITVAVWFYDYRLKAIHPKELGRQVIHFSGLLLVPLVHLTSQLVGVILCAFMALLMLVGPRTRLDKVASLFTRTTEKGYRGAFLFFSAAFLALLLFPLNIALAGIIALSVGDSASTIYGLHFGKDRLFRKKTLEGALACFFFSYFVLVFVLGPEIALPAAVLGTLLELFPWFDDNVVIPLGVCIGLTLLGF